MIKINADDLKTLFSAIGKLKNEANNIEDTLLKKSAEGMVSALRKNISEQTFGDFGVPHSKQWEQRKKREGLNPGKYWLYVGRLFKAIRAKRIKKEGWQVFVAGNSSTKNNPKEYAPEVEQRRPLFAKTREAFKKEWNKNCKATIHRMKACWY